MQYTLDELNKKFNEYLNTLDDTRYDEWYTTDRKFATVEVGKFLEWLEANEHSKV